MAGYFGKPHKLKRGSLENHPMSKSEISSLQQQKDCIFSKYIKDPNNYVVKMFNPINTFWNLVTILKIPTIM